MVRGDKADPASERAIVGSEGTSSCSLLPRTADCLSTKVDHDGSRDRLHARRRPVRLDRGRWGRGEGRGARTARAERRHARWQVLLVDRNGKGLPGNPFWDGDPSSNRSRVWAIGLRNPFRTSLLPDREDAPLVGDVGWNSWERLVFAARGANLGWPCFEAEVRTPKYSGTRCASSSTVEFDHSDAALGGFSASGGDIDHGRRGSRICDGSRSAAPARTTSSPTGRGALSTSCRHARTRRAGQARGQRRRAGSFAVGPDGALYYAAANVGAIRKLSSPGSVSAEPRESGGQPSPTGRSVP